MANDLTGQRFGRLTAVRPVGSKKGRGTIWLCQCDCGSEKEVASSLLRRGKTQSCGCIQAEAKQKQDITGQRFGRLTAIRLSHVDENKKSCWVFRCDCGTEKTIPAGNVKSGRVRSCGCYASEHISNLRKQDITGKQYGRLTAIQPTSNHDNAGGILWECRCECGQTVYYSVNRLSKGRTLSCGCLYKETRGSTSESRKDAVNGTLITSLMTAKNKRSDNKSGRTGVFYDKRTDKWMAYISFQKKRHFLGSFKDKNDAIRARKEAEERLHDPMLKDHWDDFSQQTKQLLELE